MTEQWLPLADAATQLGISVEAARMRVKRGTLQGEKRNGKVYICLNTDPTETEHDRTTDPTETEQLQPPDQPPDFDQTALVEQLQMENGRLWEANERLTRLLDQEQQLALQRLTLQSTQDTPGSTEPIDQHEVEVRTGRAWWMFWRG